MSWQGWMIILLPIALAAATCLFLPWWVCGLLVVAVIYIELGLATVLTAMLGGTRAGIGSTVFAVLMWPAVWLGWI